MPRIGQIGWCKRWVLGAGGFLGEVTLERMPPHYPDVSRPDHRCVALTNLFVHPLRRNKGWADMLLRTAIKFADANRLDLFLRAQPYGAVQGIQLKSLVALYERHGFVKIPRCSSAQMVRRYGA